MAKKDNITIANILRGCEAGMMQSVGVMQVIPLLSDMEDDRFVSPNQALVSTRGYGSLVFENPTDVLMLIPCHTGYVVKQAAQDHAMAQAAFVASNKANGSIPRTSSSEITISSVARDLSCS